MWSQQRESQKLGAVNVLCQMHCITCESAERSLRILLIYELQYALQIPMIPLQEVGMAAVVPLAWGLQPALDIEKTVRLLVTPALNRQSFKFHLN